MEDVLDVVSKDISKHFYDPNLKGLDWKALTEKSRQRLRRADYLGETIAAISALTFQLHDSHTVFIPPGRTERAVYGFSAKPFGSDILVYEVEKDGPAARAGLQLGDKILAIDNFNAVRANFFDMMFYLEYLNPTMEMDLEIVRDAQTQQMIKIPTKLEPHAKSLFADFYLHPSKNESVGAVKTYDGSIGYFKLRTFIVTPGELDAMIHGIKDSSGLILDLRGNGGGARDAMLYLAGYFTDEEYEMGRQTSRDKSQVEHVKPHRPGIACPVVVLLDSNSASASEILGRMLQLRKRAIVVGDQSSGRVNVAQVFWENVGAHDRLPFGIEIATSKLVLSNGEELETKGVTPDQFCIPSPEDLRKKKDPCLELAIAVLRKSNVSTATQASPVQ